MFGFSAFAEAPFSSEASNTFNVTVAEASTALAQFLAANFLGATVAENAIGNDAQVGEVPISREIAESARTDIQVSSTPIFPGVVLEAGETSELVFAGGSFTDFILEAATATDVIDSIVFQIGTVLEGADIADSIVASATVNAEVLERGMADDRVFALADFSAVASFTAGASDKMIVAQTYAAEIIEQAEASDEILRRLQWEDIDTFEQSDWVDIPTLN